MTYAFRNADPDPTGTFAGPAVNDQDLIDDDSSVFEEIVKIAA